MIEFPLSQGKFAIIDDDDYYRVNAMAWHAYRSSHAKLDLWYAKHTIAHGDGTYSCMSMHRFIMNSPSPLVQVDHKNNNGLDNRKENLRVCSITQNQGNSRKRKNTTSKYKGASWCERLSKWQAAIQHNRNRQYIGIYESEEDAAMAYDLKAISLFGEFAKTNLKINERVCA